MLESQDFDRLIRTNYGIRLPESCIHGGAPAAPATGGSSASLEHQKIPEAVDIKRDSMSSAILEKPSLLRRYRTSKELCHASC